MVRQRYSKIKALSGLLSLAGIIAVSCGLLEPDPAQWPPSFAEVREIVGASCTGCHNAVTLDTFIAKVRAIPI